MTEVLFSRVPETTQINELIVIDQNENEKRKCEISGLSSVILGLCGYIFIYMCNFYIHMYIK